MLKHPMLAASVAALIGTVAQIADLAIRANSDVDQISPGLNGEVRQHTLQYSLKRYQAEQKGALLSSTAALAFGIISYALRKKP